MKTLQDAIYNWLTIKVVSDARPDDTAAKDTTSLFIDMMTTEHHVKSLELEKDEKMYIAHAELEDGVKTYRFPKELIEVLINQINSSPDKYSNYPIEE